MSPIAFSDFQDAIERLYSTGKHAKSTATRLTLVLRELEQLGAKTTADLTTDLMARYVSSKGPSANHNTLNGYLGSISAACSYAVEENWLERAPNFGRVRLRPTPTARNKPRAYHELVRLLDHVHLRRKRGWPESRLCALVWTVALTGVRRDEALCAQLEDLDLVDGQILTIDPRRRLKTEAAARTVPLPDCLSVVLSEWMPLAGPVWLFPGVRRRGPWTGGSADGRALGELQKVAAEVEIDHITWHSLRHAYGTYSLERWGLPLWVVQRVLGHTDPRTTERYLHLDGSPAIADAVRGIGYQSLEPAETTHGPGPHLVHETSKA